MIRGTEILFNKKYRIYWHFLFWFAFLSFNIFQASLNNRLTSGTLIRNLIFLFPKMLATYVIIYFLVQRLLLLKKYKQFFLFSLLVTVVFVMLDRVVQYYILVPLFASPEVKLSIYRFGFFDLSSHMTQTLNIYMIAAFAVSIKLLKNVYEKQYTNQMLSRQKLEAELKFLKSQFNPHFLFNSLNNLYGLALKKSEKTPEAILTLSSLLNYMLYECGNERIPLEKEIDMLNDFIELEKLRYGSRLNVDFNIKGKILGTEIAPTLLFPFIENSFKHGASNEYDKCWINIDLSVEENIFLFSIENIKSRKNEDDLLYKTEGIGLKNVKRQLDLIYPGRYELNITEKEKSFLVLLKITLD